MRYALAAAVLVAFVGPASAQQSPDAAFNGFRQIPCRTYSNPKADPTGDLVDLMPEIWDSIYNYTKAHGGFENATACNVNALVAAECHLTPKVSIGTAVDSLYAKVKAGRPLPKPRACGA